MGPAVVLGRPQMPTAGSNTGQGREWCEREPTHAPTAWGGAIPGRKWRERATLSVLKSHFNRACIGPFKQLYRLCERRFVCTIDLQKVLSLSEAVNDGCGKEMVWLPKI